MLHLERSEKVIAGWQLRPFEGPLYPVTGECLFMQQNVLDVRTFDQVSLGREFTLKSWKSGTAEAPWSKHQAVISGRKSCDRFGRKKSSSSLQANVQGGSPILEPWRPEKCYLALFTLDDGTTTALPISLELLGPATALRLPHSAHRIAGWRQHAYKEGYTLPELRPSYDSMEKTLRHEAITLLLRCAVPRRSTRFPSTCKSIHKSLIAFLAVEPRHTPYHYEHFIQ